jgi:hypothetical protein
VIFVKLLTDFYSNFLNNIGGSERGFSLGRDSRQPSKGIIADDS